MKNHSHLLVAAGVDSRFHRPRRIQQAERLKALYSKNFYVAFPSSVPAESPLDSRIEAGNAESTVEIGPRDTHTPHCLRAALLGYLIHPRARAKSSNTAKIVLHVAVGETGYIATKIAVQIRWQDLMKGQRSRLRALINLPNRDGCIQTRRGPRTSAGYPSGEHPIIAVVHRSQ